MYPLNTSQKAIKVAFSDGLGGYFGHLGATGNTKNGCAFTAHQMHLAKRLLGCSWLKCIISLRFTLILRTDFFIV